MEEQEEMNNIINKIKELEERLQQLENKIDDMQSDIDYTDSILLNKGIL